MTVTWAIELDTDPAERMRADLLVAPFFLGERPLRGAAGRIDWRLGGHLSAMLARGALIKAAVVKGESAGVVVRVLGVTGRAARGFIPAGQTGTPRGTDLRKGFKPGTVLDLKVLDMDPRSGEPKLSVRGYKDDEERRAHREYRQKLKAEGGFGTLGDLLKQKLAGLSEPATDQKPEETGEESGG